MAEVTGLYEGDSFFTLGLAGRAGLVTLTCALTLLCVWAIRAMRWPWGLVGVVPLFAAFVWLSPQVYYLYYQMIFDGLPWQIVVQAFDAGQVLDLILFRERATLSDHGKGVLFWLMAGTAIWPAIRAATGRR